MYPSSSRVILTPEMKDCGCLSISYIQSSPVWLTDQAEERQSSAMLFSFILRLPSLFRHFGYSKYAASTAKPTLSHCPPRPLTDLPVEVISQTLSYLDSPSLCQVATTCRTLHVLALDMCLRRYDVTRRSGTIRIFARSSGRNAPPYKENTLLRALCIASVLGTDTFPTLSYITHLSWRAPAQSDTRRPNSWIQEAKQVRRLLAFLARRRNSPPLAEVELDFSAVIGFSRRTEDGRARMESPRVLVPWLKIIEGLLDTAARSSRCIRIVTSSKNRVNATSDGPWRMRGGSRRSFRDCAAGGNRSSRRDSRVSNHGASESRQVDGGLGFRDRKLKNAVWLQRFEVRDPNFLQNPTVSRWLVRWTRKVSLCRLNVDKY
ncbi:hypothetical protein DFP72DRAFT_882254 [Ephemerocybe angulata]|uniref:F-box domain-containing protein n=1 Tax=Ephemerocybe angulata TaxID=980116 RepID=A0A8H6IAB5_9AGAR|nr:hypothetical protein DFP72DRAFT_882254 [Tulosesus angulatus]